MSAATAELGRLKRQRWGLRSALALGVAATTAGNVLHAGDSIVARLIAGWAPVALMISIEAITRIPVRNRWRKGTLWVGIGTVAGVAAWVSYWHLASVAERYGEDIAGSAHLLPLSVDGFVIGMTVLLGQVSGEIRALEADRAADLAAAAVEAGQPARRGVPPLPAVPDDPGIDAIAHLGTLHAVADAEADTALDDDADVQDPDPLLPVARALADDLGAVPGRPALLQEIRKRGHKCGTDRAEKILIALRAERGQAAA